MLLLFRSHSLRRQPEHHHYQTWRTFVEARVKWVRDRGLDHVVEKEKNLRPMIGLKNLINNEPSKSLLVSEILKYKSQLSLPTRSIEFIRNHPSVFQEFLPPDVTAARPHVRLTPEVLELDGDEQIIYASDTHRSNVADRLLKLLMLSRVNKLPLQVVDRLRWDLGLPHDYVRSLVTDYPDYFQITTIGSGAFGAPENALALELVCWSKDLAVSAMEKNAKDYKKGMPLEFPLQFSSGFDLEKKVKIWVDEWQKLPYISPYEDASHLPPKGDHAEKWIVAVLHELLHILISKKTEKENILCLGDCLGLRSRFQKALTNHPGIFYVSNKIRTQTVVLREGYKRDMLLEKHPLMGMRYQYIHLMNKQKDTSVKSPTGEANTNVAKQQKPKVPRDAAREGEEEQLDVSTDSEGEEETNDEHGHVDKSDDEDEVMDEHQRGRTVRRTSSQVDMAGPLRPRPNIAENRIVGERQIGRPARRASSHGDRAGPLRPRSNIVGGSVRTPQKKDSNPHIEMQRLLRSSSRTSSNDRYPKMVGDRVPTNSSRRTDSHKRFTDSMRSEGIRKPSRFSSSDRSNGRRSDAVGDKVPRASSRRNDSNKGYKANTRSSGKLNHLRSGVKLSTEIRSNFSS
ncbi:hypothetical protein GIB67_019459 [Kingdonia uniflora]|uniref:PORR domain-containing protein n=1 Tax=Kingdonia uniflora TaxID=39325 RepID=A0A7J7MUG7_9MAGN|nr:hypothetical protein GIB67_019459 [Kingdonia uniflora]